jgi:serine protease
MVLGASPVEGRPAKMSFFRSTRTPSRLLSSATLILAQSLALAAPLAASAADPGIESIVVRLAASTTLTTIGELERVLGHPLAATEPTRTGEQRLRFARPVDASTARDLLQRLRMRRDVVWAELDPARDAAPAAARRGSQAGSARRVRKLIVTFADPQMALASRANARPGAERDAELSAAAGVPLHLARATVGGAWLVETLAGVDATTAEALASKLEASGLARYASPDYPLQVDRTPNDPYFTSGQQWGLAAPAPPASFGIDAPQAWDLTTGSSSIAVAVVDSGIVAHPDLKRVWPGYDFVSDPTSANDGDGRDADASDPGDWRTVGQCPSQGNSPADSDWHGTFVSGIIAADSNNGLGMAGVDWNAYILPVRAIGSCGGDSSDIYAGMTWAAGLPVPGVPPNQHPARVINMSLGGPGACDPQSQAFINAVLDAGVFIAVSAGNDNGDMANRVPASCLGVSTVAATGPSGKRASYSNYGAGVSIAAPGGDIALAGMNGGIVSTWNTGKTVPLAATYAFGDGTSFSAPHVAGVASLMLAVNPMLTPAQIKAMMAASATPFPAGSDCPVVGCGAGILNAFGAVQAALSSAGPGNTVPVIEYYAPSLNHYFMTANPPEINALDSGAIPGWQRTQASFNAYASATAGTNPVCRFYIPPPYDSHFYSASPAECAQVQATYPWFDYESPSVFYIALPDANGICPPGTIVVYRLFNNGMGGGPNHRYTTSPAVKAQMIAQGWIAEGYGPDQVIMCAAQ